MKLKQLFTLTLILISGSTHSQTTHLSGAATGASGLVVTVSTYTDFISWNEINLTGTEIGTDGLFALELDIETTVFGYLYIGIQKAEIFLEPGKNYTIKISGVLSKELREQDIAPFQIPPLQIEVLNPWRFELNGLVRAFLDFHDDFLATHHAALLRQRDRNVINKYISEVYDRFPGIDNEWFNTLLTFKIAGIEMMARAKGTETLVREYLVNEEILYGHMVYMEFFNQAFEKYLITSRFFDRNMVLDAIHSQTPYESLTELMKRDPLLENPRMRELVLIRNLLDLYGTPGFNRDAIIRLLLQIRDESRFTEHRQIAGNLVLRLQ